MPHSRVADSTLKGFLYQFNKTMLEILESTDQVIHVEGIVEDIDVYNPDNSIKAIQCKYHEEVDSFKLSLIYKPIILMLKSFLERVGDDIEFKLFIHIPSEVHRSRLLTLEELESTLSTKNEKLKNILKEFDLNNFDKEIFVSKVLISFGESIDELEAKVRFVLNNIESINKADVDALLYPNFLSKIQKISTIKENENRKITKKEILFFLKDQSNAVINKWTLMTKSRKVLLKKIREDFRVDMNPNSLSRCFLFYGCQLSDLDNLSKLVKLYIDKYLTKVTHNPATFIFDINQDDFYQLISKLYGIGVEVNDGMVGRIWESDFFYKDVIYHKKRREIKKWNFHVRAQTISNSVFELDSSFFDQVKHFGLIGSDFSCTSDPIMIEGIEEVEYIFGFRSII